MESTIRSPLENDGHGFNRWLFRLAGISGIAIAIGYVFMTAGFTISGVPLPKGAEAWIDYMTGKTNLWWGIICLSVITDILYLPVAAALYMFLKGAHRGMILVSGVLFSLFVVLELSITWANYPVIVETVNQYSLATTETQRLIYLSVIEYSSRIFETPVASFYMIFVPAIATILASLVMLRSGRFGKPAVYSGLLAGGLSALSVIGGLFSSTLGTLVVPGSVAALVWFFLVGLGFLKASRGAVGGDLPESRRAA